PIVSRSIAGSWPLRSATSPTARSAVSGERNSWDASAVKRCNSANDPSSRVSVSLNTVARRPSSSFGLRFGKRFESDSDVIRRAFAVRFRNGPMAEKQLFVLRPNLEPGRHASEPFVAMRSAHIPLHASLRINAELRLDQIKVDP